MPALDRATSARRPTSQPLRPHAQAAARCGAGGCCRRSASSPRSAIWAALVYVLKVPPFIAPSPLLVVADALRQVRPADVATCCRPRSRRSAASCSATSRRSSSPPCSCTRRRCEEAFFPVVVIINTIPVVAKAPILVLLLGNGMEPKIAIAALICFFPTLVNMVRGLEVGEPAGDGADARALGHASARCSSSCASTTRCRICSRR